MRMKFNKSSQLMLVSAAGLLAAGLVAACGTLTVDFVFVTSSKAAGANNYGEIDVFEINQQSGFMRQIPTSPFPSGGRNPVAEAVSTDQTNLYVVNQDDNSIVQFVIGNDGKVYPQNTVNTPGIFPLAVAINGTNLFVVDTFQPLPICSTAAPCSGSLAVLPITVGTGSDPSDPLGSPVANGNLNYMPLCLTGYAPTFTTSNNTKIETFNCQGKENDVIVPTAVNVLASGAFVYVTAYDTTASPNAGYIFAFAVAPASTSAVAPGGVCPAGSNTIPAGSLPPGTLCPINNGVVPIAAGIHPSAIASDPSSAYVYATDMTVGQVLGYSVASGVLSPLTSGVNGSNAFPAGNQPSAIVADPAYPFVYVTNFVDSTVTAYSINNGALASLGTYATGLQPVAIGIDPSTNHFLYTANYLDNGVSGSVSGFELSPTAGTLLNSQNSPYLSNAQPTAVAAIPHGSTSGNSK
jgi:6-phosphogluconolactonase (cycloisomerase 2 family)